MIIKSYPRKKGVEYTAAGQNMNDKRAFPDRCEICNVSDMKIKNHNQTNKHMDNVFKSKCDNKDNANSK
jgi:hypothetical protein